MTIAIRPHGRTLLAVFGAIMLCSCSRGPDTGAEAESLFVYCGSANKPAMEEIAALFEQETGIRVEMTFGGSGSLLAQLEMTGKGEIYLPGSPDYIIIGERKGLLFEGQERIVAYLVPAIITPAGNPAGIHTLEDLTRDGMRIGIGNPETVCLGLYGIELLAHNNLLAPVMHNVQAFGASCSKTANLAAMNQVDAILGWRVFHYWNPDAMDFVPIPPERIPRLSYIPIAIPTCTRDEALSRTFIDFVLSPAGRTVYEQFGYITDRDQALTFAPDASIGGEYKLPDEYFKLLHE